MKRVIVIGLGAMGSAAAQHLAGRGHRVLGFDHFTPPHTYGSSHGETRIIRQSYWEDQRYVPLLLRASELWHKLEADSGTSLMHLVGGLMVGRLEGGLVAGSRLSAETFGLPHRILSRDDLRAACPVFNLPPDVVALWDPNAGYLRPEACVQQQLALAAHSGAELYFNDPVIDWQATKTGGVRVRTGSSTYEADHLVITAGPWAPASVRTMGLPLMVTRQVLCWFEPQANREQFNEDRLPIFLIEAESNHPLLYGFPSIGGSHQGVKVALHGSTMVCTPQTVLRDILPADEAAIRDRLAKIIPSLNGRLLRAETCLYTMTPDEHFIIDRHPEFSQVSIAAGFSGHGFKFASVIGEILADFATDRVPAFDLGLFAIDRFRQQNAVPLPNRNVAE